ncbi:flavodoxin domain-containing protein [Neobacillus sp. FSL H8-0543]|uniref:flavodoxin domain-containing protein n=1 Tax=Neobacillus sp. FSL H8-0543 TaxID=2954672 RepID=UPI0031580E64
MKTLIVYCSSHGTTEKAVQLISEWMEGEVLAVDLKRDKISYDVGDYDFVIIGGSIHAGSIQGRIKHFIAKHHDILMTKKLGLFLCCWRDGKIAIEQFEDAFPKELRDIAVANGIFGGEFLISKMNFIEKQIVKKVSGITTESSYLDTTAIMTFVMKINATLALV